jgi:hypothetical protein
MAITGKRRLIFGLFTVLTVAVVEVIVPGWSKMGAIAVTLVAAFFYGERMLESLKGLVEAIKGKFGTSS